MILQRPVIVGQRQRTVLKVSANARRDVRVAFVKSNSSTVEDRRVADAPLLPLPKPAPLRIAAPHGTSSLSSIDGHVAAAPVPDGRPAAAAERPATNGAHAQEADGLPAEAARPPFAVSSEVVVMILGGGPGSELRPLTDTRAEPAMPFAGLFRLIDVPISNCINSGLNHIYVLSQYNVTSLNRHVARAYAFVNGNLFTPSHDGFVDCLNATQRPGHVKMDAWYQGTADAVRHHLEYLSGPRHADAEDVLILAGDQLYRMDFAELINYHRARGADVTIATTPADEDHALHLGILKVDGSMNVEHFEEKPPETTLHTMSMDTSCFGLQGDEAVERPYVASMGIYVFKKKVLLDLLSHEFPHAVDFSRDILSAVVGQRRIVAYPHTSYFEDVGCLKNYYRAHMALAKGSLKLDLFSKDFPMYTESRTLPPTKMTDSVIQDTLLGDGSRVLGSSLRGCVVGSCTFVDRGCDIQDSILFGADEMEPESARRAELAAGLIPLGVGAGSRVRCAIIDKNARIGRGVRLLNAAGVRESGRAGGGALPNGVVIREGVICVAKNAVIPDHTVV